MRIPIEIGPFVTGEIPDPLEYQYLDSNGAGMPITGYSATFTVREKFATLPTIDAVVAVVSNAALGKVTYSWVGTEFPTQGRYFSEFWIGNGVQRYASEAIEFDVYDSIGSVPVI
jgi:hypothetical protein